MLFHVVLLSPAFVVVYLIYARYFRGLNRFNGPFLASFSDLWKLWYAYTGAQRQIYRDVHERYGDIVRLGSNELSFANPQAIHDIYGPTGTIQKSDAYTVPSSPVNGEIHEVLFSGTDSKWHDRQRRLINPTFSVSQLVKYEPWMDSTIGVFVTQLAQRFTSSKEPALDAITWFAYFSLDIMSELVFGERLGFLEQGCDIGNYLGDLHNSELHWLYYTRMPILDKLTFKNPVFLWLNRHGWWNPPLPYNPIVQRHFLERRHYWETAKERSADRENLMEAFLRIQRDHPDVPEFEPFMHSMSVIGAASDSTGITLSTILYRLLKHPDTYAKLQEEVDNLPHDTPTSVPFSKANKLRYLDAVIHEAMRCHWIVRMPMNRVTPPAGMMICGEYFPGGVEVGVWGDVVHNNKQVFGEDVDMFRPERWFGDADDVSRMKSTLFSFGHGKYSCLGRNLSRIMLCKIIPSLLRAFRFELVDPNYHWVTKNGAFALPVDFNVRLTARRSGMMSSPL